MKKFINYFTGTEMWVTDERVEEYKAAGHSLAAESSDVAKDSWKKVDVKKETTKKTTTKKR